MAYNDHIQLDGKKYKVMADGWQPVTDRQRAYSTGLTGKTIIQDFTFSSRNPKNWRFRIKVFINDPDPDATWGTIDDLITAYEKNYVTMIEHDDSKTHDVAFPGQIVPEPRVPAAAIDGGCNEVFYVAVDLQKVHT